MNSNPQYLTHITSRAAPPANPQFTGADIEGPFYLPNAPRRTQICDYPTLVLSGTVRDGEGKPIGAARLEFWQADARGVYDEHGPRLRGVQQADPDGTYTLETVRPGHYAISSTEARCSHIHAKVTPPGGPTLTTQLYFPDDGEANAKDRWHDETREIKPAPGPMNGVSWLFDFVVETRKAAE